MTFMKVVVHRLVSLRRLSDGKSGYNPSFPEFRVSTILVDILLWCIQWYVLVGQFLHSMVILILSLMDILTYRATRVGVGRVRIIELCVQCFLKDHVRLGHAQDFLRDPCFFPAFLPSFNMKEWSCRRPFSKIKHLRPSLASSTSTTTCVNLSI